MKTTIAFVDEDETPFYTAVLESQTPITFTSGGVTQILIANGVYASKSLFYDLRFRFLSKNYHRRFKDSRPSNVDTREGEFKVKQKTISVKLTKERKRWSLTIEGSSLDTLQLLQGVFNQYTRNANVEVVNLASPWAEIKPRKKKAKTDAKAPEGPKEMLNG
jgi:hypothetical protein